MRFLSQSVAIGVAIIAAVLLAPRPCPAADSPAGRAEPPTKPNIIVIFVDDLGYADLGCFGGTKAKTPALDRMAAEGMRLTDFYSSCSVCTPSRASLMTGCYPRRVNMHVDEAGRCVFMPAARKGIHPDEETLAELLKTAGYATACIGKWHLGDHPDFMPTAQGFDSYFGIPYSNDMDRRDVPLPLVRDLDVIESPVVQPPLTQRYTDEALAFIRGNKDKPFFLYLPHTAVHLPLHPGDAFKGTSEHGAYFDWVQEVDASTGQILDTLEDLGLDEKTLVLFTSDNGSTNAKDGCNLPLKAAKGRTDEGGIRVPCVVRWPGRIPAGTSSGQITSTIDLLPTFVKMAGAAMPKRAIDGMDIGPLLEGKAGAEGHEVFFYYQKDQLQAVRWGKWKLFVPMEAKQRNWGEPEGKTDLLLYDLDADIGETTDVAAKHEDVVKTMLGYADEARRELGDGDAKGAGQREAGRVEKASPRKVTKTAAPNVLFISVDDLNDWVGCLGGHPQTKTPNLDRLAASGVLFRNAYCAAPSCNPSRAAVFSGLPPHRSGLYQNMQKLRDVLPNAELLPRYLSNHGYWSAGSGKLLHYVIDPPSWDDYFPDKAKDDPFPRTFYPKDRPVSLPRAGAWQYGETDWAPLDVSDEEFGGDWLVTEWIAEQLGREHDKPFFLACGIYRPHEPWFVPKKYFEPFPLDTIQHGPGVKEGDLDDVPAEGKRIARNRYFPHILEHNQWERGIQAYLASIHFSDAMLGRVLDALARSPNRDNTIIVLWSDHGWHLGEKEHWQKYTAWRQCDRVPLVIRVPKGAPGLPEGTAAGGVCDRPVSLVDLFGTLTDLCGLPPKGEIESRSLVPLLRDPAAPWPHAALTHLGDPESFAISTERWRYIHYRDGSEELYDIEADPHEWTNLASGSEHAPMLAEMRARAPKQIAPMHETQPGINAFKADLDIAPVLGDDIPPSTTGGAPVTLLFLNKRQKSVRLAWIDEDGKRHERAVVLGASRWLVTTVAGHSWLILDEGGATIGHIISPEKSARVIVQ